MSDNAKNLRELCRRLLWLSNKIAASSVPGARIAILSECYALAWAIDGMATDSLMKSPKTSEVVTNTLRLWDTARMAAGEIDFVLSAETAAPAAKGTTL